MLVERVCETERVREALRAAEGGTSSLLLLVGPLGIGRSAWLRELPSCFPEQDLFVLRAHAAPMEQDFAFGVVRQLFDSLAPGTPQDAREALLHRAGAARLVFGDDSAATAETDGGAAPDAVLHGLRALLEQLGTQRPLLILVDDVQWADDWSLRWLAYLARRPYGLRAVIVCALREGEPRTRDPLVREVAETATGTLRLAPLSRAATAEIVRDQFGEPGDDAFVRACHETSGGNPVFLMSVLVGMALAGHRPTADQAAAVRSRIPAHLRERLAACLRNQPRPIRDLVAAIATLGERGTPDLVTRLAGLDAIGYTVAARALRQLGLLAGEEEPRFVHRVVQEAAEASMTLAERQQLHETAAALLYQSGHPAEQVAAQLLAVAASGSSWSAGVLRTAADTALSRGAPDTAARYLRRALLAGADEGEERARLLIHLATAERHFDTAAAERHIAQAMSLLGTARDRAAAALHVSPGFLGTAGAGALDILRRAADDLGSPARLTGTPRDLALRLEARLSHCAREDPYELALAVRQLRDGAPEPQVCSAAEREWLAVRLHAVTLSGSLPAAQVARQAVRVLEREPVNSPGSHDVLPLVLSALAAADAVDELGPWLCGAEAACDGTAPGTAGPLLDIGRAMLSLARGRLAHAREQAERAFVPAESGRREGAALATIVLAAVALETRDPALSERVRAHTLARRPLGLGFTTMLRLLDASAEAQRGDTARALETVLDCGRGLEASGWRNPVLFPWRPRAIALLSRQGDLRAARALAEEEYKQALLWGAPVALGRAQRLRGGLRGDSEGVALLRDAVHILRGSAHELELARALRALSLALGGDAEARPLLREASGLAAACGVFWWPQQPGGGSATGTGTRPDTALTPTESRVSALAGDGLTNQEIAVELGVGSRVVEKHLTNSYRKLGISGRRELGLLLKRSGTEPRT
ncbi:AAA family ATPase [Streptomyces sp. NPDC015171]|uniref:helix-turn-helix transcriptional regulator n=1 Tax=Streptomyces sp. NPDC015171 TaxID=3364945 RepID=UPI0036F8B4BC